MPGAKSYGLTPQRRRQNGLLCCCSYVRSMGLKLFTLSPKYSQRRQRRKLNGLLCYCFIVHLLWLYLRSMGLPLVTLSPEILPRKTNGSLFWPNVRSDEIIRWWLASDCRMTSLITSCVVDRASRWVKHSLQSPPPCSSLCMSRERDQLQQSLMWFMAVCW